MSPSYNTSLLSIRKEGLDVLSSIRIFTEILQIISVQNPRLSFNIMASFLLLYPGNSTVLTAPEDWDRWIDKLQTYIPPEL
jgi:hypothetical protein